MGLEVTGGCDEGVRGWPTAPLWDVSRYGTRKRYGTRVRRCRLSRVDSCRSNLCTVSTLLVVTDPFTKVRLWGRARVFVVCLTFLVICYFGIMRTRRLHDGPS